MEGLIDLFEGINESLIDLFEGINERLQFIANCSHDFEFNCLRKKETYFLSLPFFYLLINYSNKDMSHIFYDKMEVIWFSLFII